MEIELSSGEKLKIRPMVMKDLASYEKWLEGRAFSSVQVMRDRLDASTYAEMLGAIAGQIAAGKFAFGGQACADSMRSVPGAVKILSLVSGVTESKAREILETDYEAINQAMTLAVNRSMPEGEKGPEGNKAGE
jgi:hypothetical protein